MAASTFSKCQCVTAVIGAIAVVFLSSAFFKEAWRGVVVSGAGDSGANGYYKWEPIINMYIRSRNVPTSAWRVPNVYELASRAPETPIDDDGSVYTLISARVPDMGTSRCFWFLVNGRGVKYVHVNYDGGDAPPICDKTPPTTGWRSALNETTIPTAAAIAPPPQEANSDNTDSTPSTAMVVWKPATCPSCADCPQVKVCGKDPPKPGHGDREDTWPPSVPMPAEGFSIFNFPCTLLLLAINLVFAFYLRVKQVSPDSVGVSYALFWEDREYWRLFTASFSHFGLFHLGLNALGILKGRGLEQIFGSFRYLYTNLSLVVTTIMLMMLIKHVLVRWGWMESHREGKAVGFSCVLFAHKTYMALKMPVYCVMGRSRSDLCFPTRTSPTYGGFPSIAVNFGPFASLVVTHLFTTRADFVGDLAGIFMGYLLSWGLLDGLSTPILAGLSVMLILQLSNGWASNVPDFSLLLQGWTRGAAGRVARARRLSLVLCAHVCLAVAFSRVFTWSTGLAEILALAVGYNAVQALKCCCCPDSAQVNERFCVNLLQAYGTLSSILLASDLLSLGALMGQASFVEYSGVSGTSRMLGMGLLAIAAAVHGAAIAGCVEGLVIFRDGQTFLSRIGFRQNVIAYSVN